MMAWDDQTHLHAEAQRTQRSIPTDILHTIGFLRQFMHFHEPVNHAFCVVYTLLRIEISFKEEGNTIVGFRFGMFRREILHTKEHEAET